MESAILFEVVTVAIICTLGTLGIWMCWNELHKMNGRRKP